MVKHLGQTLEGPAQREVVWYERRFTPEGFALKTTSLFRNYCGPESDFFFEALAYLTEQTGDPRYLKVAYRDFQRLCMQRRIVVGETVSPHTWRNWLPFLYYADKLDVLSDIRPF